MANFLNSYLILHKGLILAFLFLCVTFSILWYWVNNDCYYFL